MVHREFMTEYLLFWTLVRQNKTFEDVDSGKLMVIFVYYLPTFYKQLKQENNQIN